MTARSKVAAAARPAPAPRQTARKAPATARPQRPGLDSEPRLNRERRLLSDEERLAAGAAAVDDRMARAARTGRQELLEKLSEHTEAGPELTGGDIDASWEDAYAVGDEAPGGDNPTPDQDRVDDIGRALGVEYAADEELKGADKISERDRHRWELDPASSDDWPHDRKREKG